MVAMGMFVSLAPSSPSTHSAASSLPVDRYSRGYVKRSQSVAPQSKRRGSATLAAPGSALAAPVGSSMTMWMASTANSTCNWRTGLMHRER